MAEATGGVAAAGGGGDGASLKDQGNELFKAGNYLKAAALYTQAIKLDPSNSTLYSNRAAAFLQLVKLNKALADAETTITLNPQWEKGYFRKGCVLEVMERYDDAVAALQKALLYNPHSLEVSKKIKKLTQLAKDKKQTQELESIRSNIDMKKYLEPLKFELVEKFGTTGNDEAFFFLVNVMESAIKAWHEASKLDPSVYFLLDNEKTQTDKYAPVVNVDKAFESPHTHSNCFSFLRQYAEESFSKAACLVVPKSIIAYPQVWKGQGSRKWKHVHADGFFVQFESPVLRNLWFVPSLSEKGQTLCRKDLKEAWIMIAATSSIVLKLAFLAATMVCRLVLSSGSDHERFAGGGGANWTAGFRFFLPSGVVGGGGGGGGKCSRILPSTSFSWFFSFLPVKTLLSHLPAFTIAS